MKKFLLPIILLMIGNISLAQSLKDVQCHTSKNSLETISCKPLAELRSSRTVDAYDTVIFDLSKVTLVNGNYIDIPVSLKSDDVINALDFSLKYNHSKLLYDSIIDHTGYIQMTEYYNPNDSTVRFTSNSFTNYSNLTKIVSIRFKMLGLQTTGNDLNSLDAYLNGDNCSVKLVGAVIGIGIDEKEKGNIAEIYPNPATNFLHVKLFDNTLHTKINIYDVAGKLIFSKNTKELNQFNSSYTIEVASIPSGLYIVIVEAEDTIQKLKMLVVR